MSTKTYDLSYDYCPIATVQITDSEKTREVIKEMVEFWGNWEDRLRDNGGDYTKTWLKQLVIEILCSGRPPDKDAEGWVPLDGSFGIGLMRWSRYSFDPDEIQIEEV